MTHEQVWKTIDRLASERGISTSRLAIEAGLDAGAFNISKRHRKDGGERWPTLKSLAAVLKCSNRSLVYFARLMEQK